MVFHSVSSRSERLARKSNASLRLESGGPRGVSEPFFSKSRVPSSFNRGEFCELLGKTRLNAGLMEPDPRFSSNSFRKSPRNQIVNDYLRRCAATQVFREQGPDAQPEGWTPTLWTCARLALIRDRNNFLISG